MHELSIALSIVDMIEEESERRGGLQVAAVHLRIGQLAGVVKEALVSSYEMACEDTPLARSQLIIEEIPVIMYCRNCDARRPVNNSEWFICPQCGQPVSEIVQGKELELASLEISE
jgi:hydrogenase nickel incorporation protein HypA/HybF